MKTSDFDYHLPPELIAQNPLAKRDTSKLLVYTRQSQQIQHRQFFELVDLLKPGDVLIFNHSKVIPARLYARIELEHPPTNEQEKARSESKNEIFLIKRLDTKTWEILGKPGKRLGPGTKLNFGKGLRGTIQSVRDDKIRLLEFTVGGTELMRKIEKLGHTPLPPYIKNSQAKPEQYQTIYARKAGSVAAPTAGLHFTDTLMQKLRAKDIQIGFVTLHVGWGTFAPVQAEKITDHQIHSEFFEVNQTVSDLVNTAKTRGNRVIAVGTTTVRTLESAADYQGHLKPQSAETDIFIYPGYNFRCVDGMITNFHLPKSSLLMLVSAFLGREKTLEIYTEAVAQKYRFFSFGDACLFL